MNRAKRAKQNRYFFLDYLRETILDASSTFLSSVCHCMGCRGFQYIEVRQPKIFNTLSCQDIDFQLSCLKDLW